MISLRKLSVEFRHFTLKDVSLEVDAGDYFMLVGPSGAGKTLLLETVAGLHRAKNGEVWIGDEDVTALEPERRNVGMVYQDCALFPHLSVAENILFGLRVRHGTRIAMNKALGEVASLVRVRHLLDRKPGKLSGGEKQRVALARALAIRPRLLMLDEPLSALDPENREALQLELKRIQAELNVTVIHVTHDFDEAMVLGKHIAVIGDGSIRQVGTPDDIFRRPDSLFVARFAMMRNVLPGDLIRRSDGVSTFRSGGMELVTSSPRETASHACIRPEDIDISTDPARQVGRNRFTGRVARIEDRGMAVHLVVDVPPEISCIVPRRTLTETQITAGQEIGIGFDVGAVHLF
jgi:ABC-type Fe3+/spermidine/putrescine transport system ATPase subunit